MHDVINILASQMGRFISASSDGYGMFDSTDKLIACNASFAVLFHIPFSDIINMSFSDIVRTSKNSGKGIKIDTDDIETWINTALANRRSLAFRVFEVDLIDGRWFLLSEHTLDNGDMLTHAKEITPLKTSLHNLSAHSVKLQNLALTDELTQIANRRSFIASVDAEINRCQRQKDSTAFLLLDIDYFKQVNDTYGHMAGDHVLINIAQEIQLMLREYDIFGRLGGEEFGIFLSETSSSHAIEIAQRIRENIKQFDIAFDGHIINVTLSIGIAFATNECKFETLYKAADIALYRAKNSGRDQVNLIKSCT